MSFWNWLLDPSGLTPHGFCLSWAPGLIELHAGSDAIVGLSATLAKQAKTTALLRVSEAQVRSANTELERKVTEQTAELRATNARLTAALAENAAALRALAHQERQFRASFEGAAVGTAQIDPASHRILRVNPAFAEMLGHEPDGMIGQLVWAFTWPEDRDADEIEYGRLLSGEIPAYIREKRYLRSDGEPIWGRISATLVPTADDGEPALIVAVIENIDARHKAQMALQTAMTELETVVQQRTSALEQRDILLREVYHRVKNNLQIVDGLLLMQARALGDPEAKDALRALRGRVHALGLVHHQLMHSPNLKTFDIKPFLRELSDNLIGGAGGDVEIAVHAIPLEASLDFAIPLGLLVTELVTNSLKHAFADGKGHIVVGLDHGPDGAVVLSVSDDGRGRRQSGEPEKQGVGTSLITGLVMQLGGTMTVIDDNGSRTEIRLPVPVL